MGWGAVGQVRGTLGSSAMPDRKGLGRGVFPLALGPGKQYGRSLGVFLNRE